MKKKTLFSLAAKTGRRAAESYGTVTIYCKTNRVGLANTSRGPWGGAVADFFNQCSCQIKLHDSLVKGDLFQQEGGGQVRMACRNLKKSSYVKPA